LVVDALLIVAVSDVTVAMNALVILAPLAERFVVDALKMVEVPVYVETNDALTAERIVVEALSSDDEADVRFVANMSVPCTVLLVRLEIKPLVNVSPVPERFVVDASVSVEEADAKSEIKPLVNVRPVPVKADVEASPVIFTLPNVAPSAESVVAEAFTRLACDT
jgi:hypothetical protein